MYDPGSTDQQFNQADTIFQYFLSVYSWWLEVVAINHRAHDVVATLSQGQ